MFNILLKVFVIIVLLAVVLYSVVDNYRINHSGKREYPSGWRGGKNG